MRTAVLVLLIAPLLLSAIPLTTSPPTGTAGSRPLPVITVARTQPPPFPNETVVVQNQTIGDLTDFWGVGVRPEVSLDNATVETESTPVNWYVWPAGSIADSFNMTSGTLWTQGYPTPVTTNESDFVDWCRSVNCSAILTLPGEIDSPSTAAYDVAYTEHQLGFYPAYWEVGNEPVGWQHFGLNWSTWNATNHNTVNATGYAQEVHAYIAAMKAVDPKVPVIGLPGVGGGGRADGPWINATVALNGPNLSAVAIHDYPAEGIQSGASESAFLATLTSPAGNMTGRILTDEQEVAAACPNCTRPIRFLVDEFGSGTTVLGGWQQYMRTYPEIPYVTAELLMMSEANVTNADLFALRASYNGSLFTAAGAPLPLDSLYTNILPHYDTYPLATSVQALPGAPKVFAGVSESPDSNSLTLLAVNYNTTSSVQLNVSGAVFPREGTYSIWRENNSTTSLNGTHSYSTGFETSPSWVIPPLGVILVSVCRSNASLGSGGLYPLTFCASGLPPGTPWSVTVGTNAPVQSSSDTITVLVANGTYSYLLGNITGWFPPAVSGSVIVAGGPSSIGVPWSPFKFPVTFLENGLLSGTSWSVTLNGVESNSTTNQTTEYEPNGTFCYRIGPEPGWTTPIFHSCVTVAGTPVVVLVNWTRMNYTLTFTQSGLPPGTNWSVDLAGNVSSSTGTTLGFQVHNGTYNYSVGRLTGFTSNVFTGSVLVQGTSTAVPLSWGGNGSVFPVDFNETGLPTGTSWNVTLNGTTQSGSASQFTFFETNGTYSYTLAGAAGWAPPAYSGTTAIAGSTAFVNLKYARVTYVVTFAETGLPYPRPLGNWSVDVNGTNLSSVSPDQNISEPNGTYPYRVGPEPGYTTTWRGIVTVIGGPQVVAINFTAYWSTVTFNETGLPSGGNWTLAVSGRIPEKCFVGGVPCEEILKNGSYQYNATTPVPGLGLVPPSGQFNVTGLPLQIPLHFDWVYAVNFTESGLPSSTTWTVDLGGTRMNSTGSSIEFLEPNGTYSYSFAPIPGYLPSPGHGQVTVGGGPVSVSIHYTVANWTVTFAESGLPSGMGWSVTLGSVTNSSHLSDISFPVPNGSYAYNVSRLLGWSAAPVNGSVNVSGANLTVGITWTQILTFYTVTFTESGLPSATLWQVTLNGTLGNSTGSSISFPEPNGTYSYSISVVPGYSAAPSTGSVPVTGAGVSVPILFAQVNYTVTFTETGLPNGAAWTVSVHGQTPLTSQVFGPFGTAQSIALPNGTYSYSVSTNDSSYAPLNYSSSVIVNGTAVSVSLPFTPVTYVVTFTESGLPPGKYWAVTFAGSSQNLTTTGSSVSLPYSAMNGTYRYSIQDVSGWHESTIPYSGTVTVNGANLTVTVAFNPVKYEITFTETGLPAGQLWNVTLNGTSRQNTTNGGTDTLSFDEPNGTFAYRIAGISGWHEGSLPYSGSITVAAGTDSINGSAVAVAESVTFTEVTYTVTFSETGLPSGEDWTVTLNGSSNSTVTNGGTDWLNWTREVNGTLSYSIENIPGWFQASLHYHGQITVDGLDNSVDGSGVGYSITLVFRTVTYTVTFSESGLPAGQLWNVSVNGSDKTLTTNGGTDSLEWNGLVNGTYPYVIHGVSGWHQGTLAYVGAFLVTGNATSVDGSGIGYSVLVTFLPVTYAVTFWETGLPAGQTWQITMNGITNSYTTDGRLDNLPFVGLANGTYPYTISDIAGWHQTTLPYHGFVTVAGANVVEPTLVYYQVIYLISFTETGLPSGSDWNLTIGGVTHSSNGTSGLTFILPNGTYTFTVTSVPRYLPVSPVGSFSVNGAPRLVTVAFAEESVLTFEETGLPGGTNWSVTVGNFTKSSETNEIAFLLPNGTVDWLIDPVAGYASAPSTGTADVGTSASPIMVAFTSPPPTYALTFRETGLPTGTNWSVTIGTQTLYSGGAATVTFLEPSGQINYTIGNASGYVPTSPSGSISISGAPSQVVVTFVAVVRAPHGSSSSQLSVLDWGIIGVGAGVILVALLLALVRRKGPPPVKGDDIVVPAIAPLSRSESPAWDES